MLVGLGEIIPSVLSANSVLPGLDQNREVAACAEAQREGDQVADDDHVGGDLSHEEQDLEKTL